MLQDLRELLVVLDLEAKVEQQGVVVAPVVLEVLALEAVVVEQAQARSPWWEVSQHQA